MLHHNQCCCCYDEGFADGEEEGKYQIQNEQIEFRDDGKILKVFISSRYFTFDGSNEIERMGKCILFLLSKNFKLGAING